MPAALGRVLNLVRKLIAFGRQIAAAVQQHATAPNFHLHTSTFGTADLAVILARITNGLRRAVALEAALCRRAECGHDLSESPIRMPAASTQRAERQVAPPDPQPEPAQPQDLRLARLPTEQEIAAEVRRRPVGAVIVDICHDLGIAPGMLDRAFWDELCHAIIAYGGSLSGFLIKRSKRLFAFATGADVDPMAPLWPALPPQPLAPTTHPP
ncbi:MAG TPA: hypothetical protein VKT26_01235 [Acetobacteraceae bacterium]|nr:hypothetical protein [Acetobacteraceae bacterium]